MKNFLLVVATLCAATFLFADTAVAGGGGKGKSKVIVSNVNAPGGDAIAVWVLTEAEANQFGAGTVADAVRLPRKTIQAGDVQTCTEPNGRYVIIAARVVDFKAAMNMNPGAPVSSLPAGSFATTAVFDLNRDRTANAGNAIGVVLTN